MLMCACVCVAYNYNILYTFWNIYFLWHCLFQSRSSIAGKKRFSASRFAKESLIYFNSVFGFLFFFIGNQINPDASLITSRLFHRNAIEKSLRSRESKKKWIDKQTKQTTFASDAYRFGSFITFFLFRSIMISHLLSATLRLHYYCYSYYYH